MRQHKHNRRPRDSKVQDEDQYTSSRIEENSEVYSRPHRSHRPENRRASSSSTRYYDEGYRDMSSQPRSRHNEETWYSDTSRYREDDTYRRDDEYDIGLGRDSDWGPRPTGDTQYPSLRDDWSHQRYEHPSSYPEPSTWGAAVSRDAYDSRNTYYDEWSSGTTRGSSSRTHDTDRRRLMDKRDREDVGLYRDQKREKEPQPRYQSDSGWEMRHRENGWDDRMPEDPPLVDPPSVEERAWEPAPTWKPSHRDNSQHRQPLQYNHRNTQAKQPYNKSQKRYQNFKHQRRDWRNDDSNLNNWTRRDYHSQKKPNKTPGQYQPQQKEQEHRSRSRSRSPTESYHSRVSSRGASRSPSHSPAPKRRRREASPVKRSVTPSDKDAINWVPRSDRALYSRSPSPKQEPVGPQSPPHPRRKSVSSISTATSDRSRSRSPQSNARRVHRLPPASEPLTTLPFDNGLKGANPTPLASQPPSNGKHHTHDRNHIASNSDWVTSSDVCYNEPMPPPAMIPPRSNYGITEFSEPLPPPPLNISSRTNPSKTPGMIPTTKAQPPSSSLRKFFPGDDEDAEHKSGDVLSSIRPQPNRPFHQTPPPPKAAWPPPENETEMPQPHLSTWPRRNITHYSRPESTSDSHLSSSQSPSQSYVENTAWDGGVQRHQLSSHTSTAVIEKKNPTRRHQTVAEPQVPLAKPSSPHPSPHVPSQALSLPPPPPQQQQQQQDDTTQNQPAWSKASPTTKKDAYSIIAQVGEGTFGKVYKARNTLSGLLVAMKRIRMETEKDGFPVTAMREIKLLQSLRHENVVELFEMVVSKGSVYMVFEYMDHDLTGILAQNQFEFTRGHLKSLCHQMLAGLAYLHHKGVIHRDIKGSNILINNRGELKLADFGLARFYQKRRRTDYTNRVITLWYRPPELLFGTTVYGPEVDMWSAGCIMLELFTRRPVFTGMDEIQQLQVIFHKLGTPTTERWPSLVSLPWYELVKPENQIPNRFRDTFHEYMTPAALDLAEKLLAYDPAQRITAVQAMEAPYFTQESPSAEMPTGLSTLEGEWHELDSKRERAKKRKKNEGGA